MTAYKSNPIQIEDGIPIFSQQDDYINNYNKISSDHLVSLNKTGKNPFMTQEHCEEIDNSTVEIINKYLDLMHSKENIKILDVGVGLGKILQNFKKLNRFGLDISLPYLRQVKLAGIDVCLAKIEDMPYRDNFFDLIVCTDVLEHVVDLNLAIKNILSVLKPDGILFVRVPYREDLSWYISDENPYELVHVRNFDENSLKILFTKIFKLDFIDCSYSGYTQGRLKSYYDIIFLKLVIKFFKKLLNKFVKKKFKIYLFKLFSDPSEINIVFQKKT
jgi:SAM-dependent methyltransferase